MTSAVISTITNACDDSRVIRAERKLADAQAAELSIKRQMSEASQREADLTKIIRRTLDLTELEPAIAERAAIRGAAFDEDLARARAAAAQAQCELADITAAVTDELRPLAEQARDATLARLAEVLVQAGHLTMELQAVDQLAPSGALLWPELMASDRLSKLSWWLGRLEAAGIRVPRP